MNRRILALTLMCLTCSSLIGCAGKQVGQTPTPVPPSVINAPDAAEGSHDKAAFTPHDASYEQTEAEQLLNVHIPASLSAAPQKGEPDELKILLTLEQQDTADGAVKNIRPSAIREAAQLVSFQTAMSWRYRQLIQRTEEFSSIMDTAFNFAPLMLTQGDVVIMPPILAKAGASMRIDKGDTATTAKTTYEMLEPAKYVSVIPTWRDFMMTDGFPEPEKPNPALLPKTLEERALWREAVREAWARGMEEADHLYADNASRMVRSYRGAMLYHLLTAQHLLSRVQISSSELGLSKSSHGNRLNIGQKVYRITKPSAFILKPQKNKEN